MLGLLLEAKAAPWALFIHLAENSALGPPGRTPIEALAALGIVLLGMKAATWASDRVNARRQRV